MFYLFIYLCFVASIQMEPSGILMNNIHMLTCHRDDSVLLYFQVKMDSLNIRELQMWGDCCMREGWSSNNNRDAGFAMLLSACFRLWGWRTMCCLPFWKTLCSYFFRHTVLQQIMKISRTFFRSKVKEFCLWRIGSVSISWLSFTEVRLCVYSLMVD